MIRLIVLSFVMISIYGCGEKHKAATNTSDNQIISSNQGVQASQLNSNEKSKAAAPMGKEEKGLLSSSEQVKSPVSQVSADMKATCCEECDKASGKDPTGADITMKPCRAYSGVVVNDKPLLSKECMTFFQEQDLRVQDCR